MAIFDQEDLIKQDAKKMNQRVSGAYLNELDEVPEGKRKKPKQKKEKKTKFKGSFLAITPLRDIAANGAFILENGFLDIEQVQSYDLKYVSEEEGWGLTEDLATFLKVYKDDMKFMGMNYPTYTSSQQQYWHNRYKKAKQKYGDDYFLLPSMRQRINRLVRVEKEDADQEFYLIYFSEDEKDYKAKRNLIRQRLTTKKEELTVEKKIDILFKLYNPNSKILTRR
ncbi:hypothetical protein HCA69_15565 [Listeria grandensis]|uniref:Uncharacterized protein n=1 Tax=Listeria grandensis TaxID=1494963 RepID=A0A7X0Y7E2_9LIST|nr:hypothetical protein [Listeria grandensis]MBC1937787.1 hypothetical protein [Listeria grandensis]